MTEGFLSTGKEKLSACLISAGILLYLAICLPYISPYQGGHSHIHAGFLMFAFGLMIIGFGLELI